MQFAFFGTDDFSVIVLDELKQAGFLPALVVTATDKKMGRGMHLTPPPVKLWAQRNNISFLQPQKLDDDFFFQLSTFNFQLFVVASYGKIIPKRILDIPTKGALNVHPSLLPLYRGPSPIESQILDGADERGEVGVTIMQMDDEMDHGPIVAQQKLDEALWKTRRKDGPCPPEEDPPSADGKRPVLALVFHNALAHLGGALLAETIPKWIAGEITPREQEHAQATYTKKITKEDGLIDPSGDSNINYRKFRAFAAWPSVYFFKDGVRIKITDAALENGEFIIKKVIPEGKKEMPYYLYERRS